jgi:hypothetical protein
MKRLSSCTNSLYSQITCKHREAGSCTHTCTELSEPTCVGSEEKRREIWFKTASWITLLVLSGFGYWQKRLSANKRMLRDRTVLHWLQTLCRQPSSAYQYTHTHNATLPYLTKLLHRNHPSSEANLCYVAQHIPLTFLWNTNVRHRDHNSLPKSPCPKSDQKKKSNPRLPISFLEVKRSFILFLSSHLHLDLPSSLFRAVSPPKKKLCEYLYYPPFVPSHTGPSDGFVEY